MNSTIRIRACVVVIRDNRVLLFPHIVRGELIWYLPGGGVDFSESLRQTAERECYEETGIRVQCHDLIDVVETIEPEVPYHGISHVFMGGYLGGEIISEKHPVYGEKTAQWFSIAQLRAIDFNYSDIEKVMNFILARLT